MKATKHRCLGRSRAAGVTLIELMIVVVVLGTLMAIAIPSYRQYTIRTHRTEAKTALLRISTNQERWYLQNNTFSANLADVGFPTADSENGVYTLTIDFADTAGWQATANPTPGGGSNGVNQGADGDCTSFTLDSAGVRTATGANPTTCW